MNRPISPATHIRAPRLAHAPVLVLPDLLDPELCRRLIAFWESGDKVQGLVRSRDGFADVDKSTKRRVDVLLSDQDLLAALHRAFAEKVGPAVQHVFQYRMVECEAVRIGCYDAQDRGFFAAHRDNTTRHTMHRHFALSLNLNQGAYKGGQLRFPEFASPPFDAPTGGGVIFSCSLLHEALPVTRGRRFGAFTFFYDEAGAAHVRRMMAEQRQRAG